MTLFVRQGDGYAARFDAIESQVLHDLLTQLVTLLTERDRTDPMLARLFPDVYPDDPDASAEFRQYTDEDLAAGKLEQIAAMIGTLPRGGGVIRLNEEQVELWLRALTDARLALGIRLGVRDDTDISAELDTAVAADPVSDRVNQLSIYEFLTYIQTSLLEALVGYPSPDLPG
jgi:hypothetical protein